MPADNDEVRPVPGVVVQADDLLTRDGTAAFLEADDRVKLLPAEDLADADILIVLTAAVTGKTLSAMSRAGQISGGRLRIVLVADNINEQQLALAVNHGLVSFLVRPYTSFSQIAAAAVEAHHGRAVLPPLLTNMLLDRMRTMQRTDSHSGLLPVELSQREVDVLQLLAEGMDTVEIANKLSYSERLIKSVIQSVTKRLELRNRTHAVAYAIRMGIL
ncbi:LuxR C-terminal-related transcriptional regulator [Streptomyces griseoviridis]|jgi:DNA-binding NarL/FixJ family response regulator|uniref:Helix-turn-helix transcriptional regulator n=3 Tax=Streptomyces TaxID=1883 RepID=A0A918GU88_STRGD|nr:MULTISPECIES: LuxR C-terminal-related transcriptional regulator [Streptomyces]MDP9685066.1 DNA-binding NarL/FixJ family response regulator [Streptomyces griseoviridis]GGS62713.1 helix-turn-helix transcriptional regulator [Streptomyces niveoruber]GGT15016.1 helix-turn-helix transcriptional regulator [Streptomyces griseoviridis]GGU60203.1 helix-turn-helix transcriptional regulator [Streptomyces daghestanicus]GHI33418.1 helix-turn-helix transcriptional regulator [Streptomyces daghestanicus]